MIRFAIDNSSADWSAAEGQVARMGNKNVRGVVSVKQGVGVKRKMDTEDGRAGAVSDAKKQTRRSKKVKR